MNNEDARMNALIALRGYTACLPPPAPIVDAVVTVDGIELGIVITNYEVYPPTGRCAAMCETPEEFYGHRELEYEIKSVWNDEGYPHYDLTGANIPVPPELSESDVDCAVLDWIEGSHY